MDFLIVPTIRSAFPFYIGVVAATGFHSGPCSFITLTSAIAVKQPALPLTNVFGGLNG